MMNITTRATLFLTALLCIAGAAAAFPIPAARIVRAEEQVSIRYAGTEDFVSVWRGEKAGPGDTVATGPGGIMEMRFSDGTRVVLGPSGSLTVSRVTPRRIAGIGEDGRKTVLDITMTLLSGRLRAAVGPGGNFTLTTGGGTITVATCPETGADVTAAMGIFPWGKYISVGGGCAFVSGPAGGPIVLCSPDGRPDAIRLPGGGRAGVDESLLDLAFSGDAPAVTMDAASVPEVTVDGAAVTPGADGVFHLPETVAKEGGAVTVAGTVQDNRAVIITGGGGAVREIVLSDETGRWKRTIEIPPGAGTELVVAAFPICAPPKTAKEPGVGPAPPTRAAPAEEEKTDPDAVASRFVQAFSGALSRGDTGALSALVSPDYNGAAGGAGRSALLAGVSDFFRAGGTLTISAYASTANLTEGAVIVTMSFSSRVNGAPKSGALRLWLTSEGQLTHAEGDWVL